MPSRARHWLTSPPPVSKSAWAPSSCAACAIIDGSAKAGLTKALKTASEPAMVRSAFDLPAEQRAAIQNALNETFSVDLHLRFETAPDLIGGIELSANGQKVAWSISDYLEAHGERRRRDSGPFEAGPVTAS